MGADDDITVTHVADVGLKLKQAGATGDDSPFILTLQTGELDIAADDVLGQIDFQAPDEATGTDAILVAAGISAISEGDFSSSSNATKLSFKTGASAAATEKMYITSAGNVNMKNTATGDDTPMVVTLQTGETDIAGDDVLGKIAFQAPDEATGTDAILVAAAIQARSEGDFSSSSNATSIDFMTGSSEVAATKMSLKSDGTLNLNDNILQRANLQDYGEVTNAIGATGGGAQAIDLSLGNSVSATVDTSANTFTFTNPTASDEACSFTLILTNGGSQTVTWPASVDWAAATAPTLTASGVDVLVFTTIDGGTTWHGMAASLASS